MTKYTLTLYCKNKESINNFLKFLENISKTQNFQIFKKLLKKKKTKKKISVLKSPHVNKTAQEQFEYIYYFTTISFYSWDIKKYFILLKKVKNQLFPDIKIQVKIIKTSYSKKNKLININKILFYKSILITHNNKKRKTMICKQPFITKNQFNNTLLYLKMLDYYGEF